MSSLNANDFIYVEGGRNLDSGGFTRNEWMKVHDIPEYRKKHNNIGLYTTAYFYDSDDVKNANLYGNFYLDFDNEEDFEMVRHDVLEAIRLIKHPILYGIPEKFMHIFYSGKKGVHIIIPAEIFGIEPDFYLNEYFKLMAEELKSLLKNNTLDSKIYDRRRLLRLPNSIHKDTGLYKVPLTVEEMKTLSLKEIREKASRAQNYHAEKPYEITNASQEYQSLKKKWKARYEQKFSSHKNKEAKPLGFTPACTQELIDMGPQKGKRNHTITALVSHWNGEGLSEQEIWDKLVAWNDGSLTERELRITMKSIIEGSYRYGCSTLSELATCTEHKCPLWKGKQY